MSESEHISRSSVTHHPKAWDASAEGPMGHLSRLTSVFGLGAERIELSTPCLKVAGLERCSSEFGWPSETAAVMVSLQPVLLAIFVVSDDSACLSRSKPSKRRSRANSNSN